MRSWLPSDVTGCFTAALLMQKGVDVSLLARGDKAARLVRDSLHMRNGMTSEKANARLSIVRAPVAELFDVVMVCVQALHRPSITPLLRESGPGQGNGHSQSSKISTYRLLCCEIHRKSPFVCRHLIQTAQTVGNLSAHGWTCSN